MLTLSDINRLTNSHDGDIYSDLYKDVYGSRPRYAQFDSVEEFDRDYEFLCKKLSDQLEIKRDQQAAAHNLFVGRLMEIRQIVSGSSYDDAVRILCDAEDISAEEINFYGWESLEWKLGLKFGSVKQFLAEVDQLETA